MPTECNRDSFEFGTVERRNVVGAFDGGTITSDAGALLLGQTDKSIRLVSRLADCFQDGRNPTFVFHQLPALLRQRIFGIALGYEDIVDHDQLGHDPVLGVLGNSLTSKRSDCAPLAGKSTLNRLEHAAKVGSDPYHKITHDPAAIERLFVTVMMDAYAPVGTGATDVIGRIVAEGMSKHIGQSVIIENVAGAGGTTGAIRVMKAAPDGYTLLTGHMGTHASSFSLYEKKKYDPRTDFQPIGLAASAPIVVFGRKDLQATTFQEFVALMKSKGPDLKVAHSGIGSNAHLTCTLLNALAGTNPVQVAYRGNGPLMNDLLVGVIDYSCDQVITVASQVQAGTIKAFAVAAPKRSKALPETPTTEEGGLKAFQADAWTAIFAPNGLPADVLGKIHAAYTKAMSDPDTIAKLEKLGAVAPSGEQLSQAYLKALVASDVERWAKVITEAKIVIKE